VAKGDDIEERLIDFAVRIVKLCNELPDTPAGQHVAGHLTLATKSIPHLVTGVNSNK